MGGGAVRTLRLGGEAETQPPTMISGIFKAETEAYYMGSKARDTVHVAQGWGTLSGTQGSTSRSG